MGDGSDGCEGNLEYCGSENASITDRPLAVNGKGRLTNASGYNFTFADVCTKGASSSTLTLDGDDVAARNVLTGVNDSKDESGGALSIVKEGQGTWILKDDVSLRGSIEVKKGMLVVENMYTWYKWVIKSTKYETYFETQGTEPGNTIAVTCSEFGLYSADGGRQNAGLTYKRLAYPNLKPGEIDYGFVEEDGLAFAGNVWMADVLCDGMTTTPLNFWYRTKPDMEFAEKVRNVPHHVPEQETTWLPVVMRLADDALPVARYDYATSGSGWTSVYRSRLYASVDGVNWDELEDEDRVEMPSGKWEIADREFVGGADNVHTNALGEVDGQLIASVPEKYRSGYMENVRSYSVAAGATLRFRGNARIRGLKFGYGEETGGVIEGADFAGAGTLEITDFPKSAEMAVMNYTLRNCTGFDNVARWAISENGSVNPRLSASVKDGRIVVVRNGMVIFVR
ncbi:MAG: hypothetical protein IKC80_04175 [Kiritimatiellae bacterium]|nr:hypothetical protein [Kiritimatiellia bacterium]